jgi:hypothetical protein
LAGKKTLTNHLRCLVDHGLLAKAFPRRKDEGTEEATRALLMPKKSRTKDENDWERGEGIEMGDYVSKLAS